MKKYLVLIFMFFYSFTIIQASSNQSILITSDQLNYYFIASIKEDHIDIYTLPSIDSSNSDLKSELNELFSLDIDNYVQLNLSEFESEETLDNIESTKKYFKSVVSSIDASMLFHIHDYITSDLSLSDYFDLFQLVKKPYPITIHYCQYFIFNDEIYFLTNEFTTKKQ